MTWKSFVPLAGKKTVRKKLSEIEDEAASLPIIFGVLSTKVIEQLVMLNFIAALKFALSSLAVAVAYVYRHEAKKKAEEVKDEVTE